MSTAQAHTRTPLMTDWRRRYEVLHKLGSGGFADVYETWDREWQRPVALKVIDERRGFSARVLREVQAAAALDHPNIVALYDYFSDGEQSYLVWELVPGASLASLRKALDDVQAVEVVAQVLEAVAYAHGQGIVHRDLKPQNIMLDDEGRAKVMDFGIARLADTETITAEGDMLGTVAYMSPEQAAGRRVGPASDVYSAAVVLFELLGGVSPVRGATAAETISTIVGGRALPLEAVRSDLPVGLLDAVDLALSTAPADRPTAAEFADALRAVLAAGQLSRGRRARDAARPLSRGQELAERFGGAALAGVSLALALPALPAYPGGWTLPLAAGVAAVWALLPGPGLALLLGALAFPFFNLSLHVGIAYLLVAVVLLALGRSRPVCVVWPAFALALTPVFGTLLAPAAAAVLGRVRGPVTAVWSAAATCLALTLSGHTASPFAGFQAPSALGRSLAAAGDPLTVLARAAGPLVTPTALTQLLAWAGLAAALRFAWSFRAVDLRLWVWAAAFASVFAATALVPAAGGRAVTLHGLLASVGLAAVVVLFVLVSGTVRGRHAHRLREDESVQEDRAPA